MVNKGNKVDTIDPSIVISTPYSSTPLIRLHIARWLPAWLQLQLVLALSLCLTSHQCFIVFLADDACCHKHLLIYWEHPSHGPSHKIVWLDDVHSAKLYADTHCMQIQSDSNEVLCGIILFIDQMFMADNDHQGSECPLFTLSILPRHICNQPWAWRPLGFIPKFELHHSRGQNMEALHLVLTCILSVLHGIQEI